MKKVVLGLMLVTAGVVSADLAVDIVNSKGFLKAGETGPAADTVLDAGALVQLIWAPSNLGYQVGNLALNLLKPGEFEVFRGSADVRGTFALGVNVFVDSQVGNVDVNDGYFYARIFDTADGAAGSNFVELGIEGSVLKEYLPGPPPVGASIYSDSFNDTAWLPIDTQGTTVIPEPATFGLMGVAGLGLFLARKKARR